MTAALHRTRSDYDANAERYAAFVDDPANTAPLVTALITAFADTLTPVGGTVLDAGCGPGQWTAFLNDRGVPTTGLDLSPVQIALARTRRPDLSFEVGSLLDLPAPDASFAGALVHFSLIHTPPDDVPVALAELHRVLVDGGVLLLGGFATDGPAPEAYDHKLSPAHRWPVDALATVVRRAGFTETARVIMQPPPTARSAPVYLMATKTPG